MKNCQILKGQSCVPLSAQPAEIMQFDFSHSIASPICHKVLGLCGKRNKRGRENIEKMAKDIGHTGLQEGEDVLKDMSL